MDNSGDATVLRATLGRMALPVAPVVPLTVDEYAALPEDGEVHYELQEGVLVPMASPTPEHQLALGELQSQLRRQLPGSLLIVPDVDIDLQIVPATRPGFVRRPDLSVVTRAGVARRRAAGGILRADEVVLAIEFVSIGSERTDRVIKRGEYADAGIGHYWMVDLLDGPDVAGPGPDAPGPGTPSLTACRSAGEFGYVAAEPGTGVFTIDDPFPMRIDLARLR